MNGHIINREQLVESGNCSVYHLQNETGEGTITIYDMFPSVALTYNDFHMQYYDSDFRPGRYIFCIDYCREGRIEYTAKNDVYSYVEAGDLELDRRLNHTGRFGMPLSRYNGAALEIDIEESVQVIASEDKKFSGRPAGTAK